MRQMAGLNELREQGGMTWIEQEHGWVAAPEEIVEALSRDGFEECRREMTMRPIGGAWQGVETRTGSVASAIWVNRPAWQRPILGGRVARSQRAHGACGIGDLGESRGTGSSHRLHRDRWGVAQGRVGP